MIALKFRTLTYIYLLILLAGTVIPFGNSTLLSDNYTMHIRWDYLLHGMIYLPVPGLLFLSLREGPGNSAPRRTGNGRLLVTVILVSLLVTVLFEGLQLVIPYRSFNINDMTANGVGAVIGLLLVLVFRKLLEDIQIRGLRKKS